MKTAKRIVLVVLALGILVGAGFGGVYAWNHRTKKEVKVYAIEEGFAMTDYWGDNSETEGMVSVQGLQTIYLSDTQTVKAVLVHEGQQVHQGDPLVTYDTTLTELDVRKKDVAVQQLQLQLDQAQKELDTVKSYRPNVFIPGSVTTIYIPGIPAPEKETFVPDGTVVPQPGSGDGKTPESAFIYKWDNSYAFDDAFLYQCMQGERDCYVKFILDGTGEVAEHVHTPDESGWQHDSSGHWHNCSVCGEEKYDLQDHDLLSVYDKTVIDGDKIKTYAHDECGVCGYKGESKVVETKDVPKTEPETPDEPQEHTHQPDSQWQSDDTSHWHNCKGCTEKLDKAAHTFDESKWVITKQPTATGEGERTNTCTVCGYTVKETLPATGEGGGSNPTPARTQQSDDTQEDSIEGYLLMQMQHSEMGYQIQILAIDVPHTDAWTNQISHIFQWSDSNTLPELPPEEEPEAIPGQTITDGTKYTAAELSEMIQEADAKARDLDVQLRQAKLEYEKAEQELNNGAIYSNLDGKVSGVLTQEEAAEQGSPLLRVTAGGGYYIQGTLSELERESIEIGQTVTVSSWMSGAECEGTITEISEYPSTNGYNWGAGNSNVSYYPFTVFVDESAGLQEGEYVQIQYSGAQGDAGFYLESMFIRSENGRSYVYVQGEDGKLEKRYISTGKTLWGSYTQVKGGITVDACLAFPYGSNVVEGAPTVLGTTDEFYGW